MFAWFKTVFQARFQNEKTTRDIIRKEFKPKLSELINSLNEFLTLIQLKFKKPLLILIDDTDKIPPDIALKIFYENAQQLSLLQANMIFVIDTSMSCSSKYATIRAKIGEEEFFSAVKIREKNEEISMNCRKNREIFKTIEKKGSRMI